MPTPASPAVARPQRAGPEVDGVALTAPYGSRGWRVRGKRVHLTYAGLFPGELSMEDTAKTLAAKCKHGCFEIVVGREKHRKPTDKNKDEHFHVYLSSKEPWDTTNQNYFDLRGRDGRRLHPYIQIVPATKIDRERVIAYDMKDGDVIMKLAAKLSWQMDDEDKKWSETVKEAVDGGQDPAAVMDMLWSKHPDKYLMYHERVSKAVKRRHAEMHAESPANYKMSDFNMPPQEFADNKCVVLAGSSGNGKTEYALAHFERPVLVRTRDDLLNVNNKTDGVVLDDMSFTDKWTAEETIHLLDMAQAATIKCRYSTATIPKKVPRIFTTNADCDWQHHIFRKGSGKQQAAIKRRFRVVQIEDKLYGTGTEQRD